MFYDHRGAFALMAVSSSKTCSSTVEEDMFCSQLSAAGDDAVIATSPEPTPARSPMVFMCTGLSAVETALVHKVAKTISAQYGPGENSHAQQDLFYSLAHS